MSGIEELESDLDVQSILTRGLKYPKRTLLNAEAMAIVRSNKLSVDARR